LSASATSPVWTLESVWMSSITARALSQHVAAAPCGEYGVEHHAADQLADHAVDDKVGMCTSCVRLEGGGCCCKLRDE
jgi:hypothetical protein